jgi:hypothetical protein
MLIVKEQELYMTDLKRRPDEEAENVTDGVPPTASRNAT